MAATGMRLLGTLAITLSVCAGVTQAQSGPRIRPGTQAPEPEPVDASPKPKHSDTSGDLPLPPAPNALPEKVPDGDVAAATLLASPEKVETLVPFRPDPAPAMADPPAADPIPLRPLDTRDNAGFEHAAPLLFTSPDVHLAFVPHRNRAADADSDTYYDRYDLVTGQRTGGFAVPAGGRVLDVSRDGTRLLASWTSTVPDAVSVPDDSLGVFAIANDRLQLRAAWRPYAALRDQSTTGVDTARFVDDTHVLTTGQGDLTLWDVDTARAFYRLFPVVPCRFTTTPGGRYVAVVTGTTPCLIDAATGQPTLRFDGSLPAANGSLYVRPDCKQLAVLLESRLLVWPIDPDAPSRTPRFDVSLDLPNPATTLDWLADGYVLVNNRYCVDLARRMVIWEYESEQNGVGGGFAGDYWYSTPSKLGPRVLVHTRLPHDAAVKSVAAIDPASAVAIGPGTKVSIDLSKLEAEDVFKSRAIVALTAKLQSNGLEVAEKQPIRLVVTSTPGDTREITYQNPSGGQPSTVELPEDLVTVAFVQGGTTLWKLTRPATPPGTLALRPGQSVEDFLIAERGRLRLTTAVNVTYPKYVAKPHPVGHSMLTDSGPSNP